MARLVLVAILFFGVTVPVAESQPTSAPETGFYLEIKEGKRVAAVLTYTASAPKLQAAEWIAFAAVAPELPGQTQVKTTLAPGGQVLLEKSPARRGVLRARIVPRGADQLTTMALQVNYEATLRSRTLRPLTPDARPERVAPLTPVEKKLYLAEEREIDFGQDPVKKWLKTQGLVRDGKESDIALARRVFLKIRAGFGYEYKGEMDRRASNVCTVGKSDCGGLAALFVAAMRANGVPARMLYGRWAESARADDQLGGVAYYQWHVKAEFHADGVGWVPVDLSSAILHDRSDEGLQYFGKDRGDFLTFHVDPDLLLDTVHFGLIPMQNLQIPAWWVTGKGTVAGHKATQDWKVTPVK